MTDSPAAIVAAAVAAAPGREAIVFGDLRLTYADYGRRIAGFARALVEWLPPAAPGGDPPVIALLLRNGPEIAVAITAAQLAGATVCPLNPDYTPRELSLVLADARPVVVVLKSESEPRVHEAAPALPRLLLPDDPADWPGAWRAGAMPSGIDPDRIALMQYTGGTTGTPKGAELTHRALAANIAQREAILPGRDGDRVLCVMPLFHSFAMAMGLYLAAACRGTLVILPRYRPDWTLDAIARERVSVLPAGPTVFNGLLSYETIDEADLSSLRACYSGSAALPAETLARWRERTGLTILEGYGQTEAGPILTYATPDDPPTVGSVGRPLPDTEIQIVDPETGLRVLPPGTPGEIRARGPQLMRGYRDRPAETARALRDGWLHTGDVGDIDENGRLFIRDRLKEMIVTAGFNVYPREVEEVLMAHPDVDLAAVIGVPDDYRGEVPRAFIRRRDGAETDTDALRAWCAERLAKYKIPAEFRFVAALPMTAANKIDKRALRG